MQTEVELSFSGTVKLTSLRCWLFGPTAVCSCTSAGTSRSISWPVMTRHRILRQGKYYISA
jgi:hypothetical protein